MNDWSHGYNVSQGYTYGYYREMAPDWLDMCARMSGYLAPDRGEDGSFRYLDMGTGQGFGLCLLAAANPDGEFVGIDFNPEHVAHATRLAAAGGLKNVRFVEGDFTVLAENWPSELGQFDYVAMHGICSWIPKVVRGALVRCLDQAVAPGGLVYNSYNTQPGWITTMPFQHLARRMQIAGGKSSGPAALDATIAMFDKMEERNTTLFRALPTLKSRLASVRTQNRAYLVQEYLHESWTLFWFSEMMDELRPAKLAYVGTATISEQMLPGVLDNPLREIIEAHADPIFRQEVLDAVINQSFRRDILCRGPQRAFGNAFEGVKPIILQLVKPPQEDELTISTSFGDLALKRDKFGPVVNALTDGPMTIGDLLAVPSIVKLGLNAAIQSMMLLVQQNHVMVSRSRPADPVAAQRFNAAVAKAASSGAPYAQIAIPSLGSALPITDSDLMMLDTWTEQPGADAATIGKGLAERLKRNGRRLSSEGKALDDAAQAKRIGELSEAFVTVTVPRLRRAGAIA